MENESVRQEAVEATLERNPNAFRPKIASSPSGLLRGDSRVYNIRTPKLLDENDLPWIDRLTLLH